MTTYAFRGGPLDGHTVEVTRGNRSLYRSATGERTAYNRIRPEQGFYVCSNGAYWWAPDVAAQARIRAMPAPPTAHTWTFRGGPLDGRRITIEGRAEKWRTVTGTPWPWSSDPWCRYYVADAESRTYRHVQEDA